MIWTPFALLGPEIKIFMTVAAITGPIAIGILIFVIKRIEKENPDRIRWR